MTTKPPLSAEPSVLRQAFRFSVVGAVGFVVDVGGFNLLRYAGGEGPLHAYPLTAKVISGVLATVVALVAGLGTLIAMSCLWVSHYLLALTSPLADNISANVIGLGLALTFRFWAYRRHVFSGSGDGSGLSARV